MASIRPLVILPPVIFGAMALLFGIGMFRDDPDSLPSARAGQPAPPVVLGTMDGKTGVTDSMVRTGEVKLVNFWASWCAPCRAEHPTLEKLSGEGVTIYGINYKDDPAKALAFLGELGDPYAAIGTDESGRTALDWGLYGVPETFVIDATGRIILRFAGPVTSRVLEDTIRPAMAEAEAGS